MFGSVPKRPEANRCERFDLLRPNTVTDSQITAAAADINDRKREATFHGWFGFKPKVEPMVFAAPPSIAPLPYEAPRAVSLPSSQDASNACEAHYWDWDANYPVAAAAAKHHDVSSDVDTAAAGAAHAIVTTTAGGSAAAGDVCESTVDDGSHVDASGARSLTRMLSLQQWQRSLDDTSVTADMQVFATRMQDISFRAARDRKRIDAALHDPFARIGMPVVASMRDFTATLQSAVELEAYCRARRGLVLCKSSGDEEGLVSVSRLCNVFEATVRNRAFKFANKLHRTFNVSGCCVIVVRR
jgi:hypothetical protein